MTPKLIEQKKKMLIGMDWYGALSGQGWREENPIGQLWTRFNVFWDAYQTVLTPHLVRPEVSYEINIWNDRESEETGQFCTFVGVEVSALGFALPPQLVAKTTPAATYAHIVVRGEAIRTWERTFYNEWLPPSAYELGEWYGYHFQIQAYEEGRFHGVGELLDRSEIEVYVPLKDT